MAMRTEFDDGRESDSQESSPHLRPHDTQVGDSTTSALEHEPASKVAPRLARGSASGMQAALAPAEPVPPDPEAEAPDLELTAALEARDDHRVMEILVDRYGEHVYCYCRRMVRTAADSDDLSQKVFMQAFQDLKKLSRIHSIRRWLLRIAHNRCIDWLRARKRDAKLVDNRDLVMLVDGHAADRTGGDDPRIAKALDDCFDRLDERSRYVLVLRFHDGLPYNEIGDLMSDTAGALRVRLARALKLLRRCLERKGVRP